MTNIQTAKRKLKELEARQTAGSAGILMVRLMPDGSYLHRDELLTPEQFDVRAAKASITILDDIPG